MCVVSCVCALLVRAALVRGVVLCLRTGLMRLHLEHVYRSCAFVALACVLLLVCHGVFIVVVHCCRMLVVLVSVQILRACSYCVSLHCTFDCVCSSSSALRRLYAAASAVQPAFRRFHLCLLELWIKLFIFVVVFARHKDQSGRILPASSRPRRCRRCSTGGNSCVRRVRSLPDRNKNRSTRLHPGLYGARVL